ncbi:MAG: hypothetical protein E7173_03910 [Firmicutes bacterium]|nr:hypothetical protein [Bacillota bacterium]
MDKKLPKVFANPTEKKFTNNDKVYYSKNMSAIRNNEERDEGTNRIIEKNIYQKINDIFVSERYVYKADVEIITRTGKKRTKVIGQNKTHIITMDNELIPITDIEDINFVN